MINSTQPDARWVKGVKRSQRGIGTLAMTMILLFMVTFVTLYLNRNIVLESKIANNQYFQTQALEAATGGVEFAIAWLGKKGNDPAWTGDTTTLPPNTQKDTTSIAAQTIGAYTVNVSLWQKPQTCAAQCVYLYEIQSVATGDATATVRQLVSITTVKFTANTPAPLVVNGCVKGATGHPSVNDVPTGQPAVIQSQPQPAAPNACTETTDTTPSSHLDIGSASTIVPSAFPTAAYSAWYYVFSASPAEMKLLAQQDATLNPSNRRILYYDWVSTTPPNNWHDDLGTGITDMGILVFDPAADTGCPKLNGGVRIYGIVYFGPHCTGGDNGWGGATITGSVISETDITHLTANSDLHYLPGTTTTPVYNANPIPTKVAGSWRDF